MSEPVLVEHRPNGVVIVRLNRPERLNALSAELMDRLAAQWRRLAGDRDLRAIVLTGEGRGFCSGADASFLSAERAARGAGIDDELDFVPGRIVDVPVIVAVNGICAGGGLHFVADADIVIAGRSAAFVDPHVSVGQVSGIEPASLALRLPLPVIARLALVGTAERLSAARAYELGLVTELVEDAELLKRAVALADAIAAASPQSVRLTRRALRRVADRLEPLLAAGWADVQAHWAHPDSVEGPRAFAEKRPPRWAPPADIP
jgi:enoyl-CoA hydratase/carnithine racemase